MWGWFRWHEGGHLSGGMTPMNIVHMGLTLLPQKQKHERTYKPPAHKPAPKQRPMHKTRFR